MALARKPAKQEIRVWLVWCFEHCLKHEQCDVRKELKQCAASTPGCKFVCHKKSMDFLRWLEDREGSTLLIADWREAKPILVELSKNSKRHNLHLYVVARTEKIFHRASCWAGEQSTGGQIMVTLGFSVEATKKFITRHTEMDEELPVMPPLQTTSMDTCCLLSLPSLLAVVRDPVQADRLEKLIQNTMWQTYED